MRYFRFTLVFLMVTIMAFATASYVAGADYTAMQISGLVIDGDLSEWGVSQFGDWGSSQSMPIEQDRDGTLPDKEDHMVSAMTGWSASDPERLYFAFQVEDDEYQDQHDNWWETDAIEIGIDGTQYGIIVNETLAANATEDNTEAAVKHEEVGGKHRYSYEVAIKPGNLSLKAGDVVLIAIAVDDSEGGARQNSVRWLSNERSAMSAANHGEILLGAGIATPAAVDFSDKLTTTWARIKALR